jgi:hypothetical protein
LAIFLFAATPAFASPIIGIEKTTNGPTNANLTAPDYDNEDTAGGPGVPILTPLSPVTWTYQVTNTGNVSFFFNTVAIVDDHGTPGNTADDLSTVSGQARSPSLVYRPATPTLFWSQARSGCTGRLAPSRL